MKYKLLSGAIISMVCAAAAVLGQSGPDNDPDAAPGYVNSVFHHGQVDSINLYNGQLTIPISLGPAYPVGPKLKFQAVLTYSSRKNDYGHPTIQPPDYVYYPFEGNPALGHGWEFTLGAIKPCKQGNTGGYCYFGPDGSQHMFNQGPKTGDGSQLYLTGSGPFQMWDGDGNHYVFGWQVSGLDDNVTINPGYVHDFGMGRDGWYLTSVTDPFGNSYSVSYHTVIPPCWSYGAPTGTCTVTPVMTCPAGPVATWIPRAVALPTGTVQIRLRSQGPTSNMISDFVFPVAGGGSAVWSLSYEQVWDNFHDCSSATIKMPILIQRITEIRLPSDVGGSPAYRFSNSCPFTMTLPTGASIAYTFGMYTFFHGRAGAVVPNCQGMTPQNVQYVETSSPDVCGLSPEPEPPGPRSAGGAACTPDNDARWMDTVSGVLRRVETIPGMGTATTDYTQYSFPYGEEGSISAKQDAETLTVVLLPADADNRRRARAMLFRSSPVSIGPSGTLFNAPGDRVGADLEERVFDGDPNTPTPIPTSAPCCGGAGDQPFCASMAARVTQRVFEYDDAGHEIGNRRLKVENVCYGPTSSTGSCQTGLSHTVALSNPQGVDWDTNGRHYNIEQHSGTLGNDQRTVTTTWTPSVSPWLPNLFNRRTETQGSSTVDHYFEFTPSNGFSRGEFLHDAARQMVFLTCRYDDGLGSVGQDFSATYSGWPGPPPSDACSRFYPAYPTTGVGVNGDAFGKIYTHRHGQLLTARWMANPTTPAGWFVKNLVRDPATGWITFSADPAGLWTGYAYDSLGRVTSVSPPGDTSTTVRYDSTTQTTATRDGGAGLFTLERYIYDGLGRASREIRLMPSNSLSPYAVRLTQYDPAAHTSFVSEWAGCPDLSTCATSIPSAGTRSFNFDPLGRPQTIRNADGATTSISYGDGSSLYSETKKSLTVGNVNGICSGGVCSGGISATTLYRYDASGRLTSVTEPGDTDLTSYSYDVNGKLIGVSQGVQTRTFAYDAAGFLRSEITPEKGAVTYDSYGSLGNLLSQTEPGGLVSTRTYDFAGRLTGVVSSGRRYLINCYDGQGCADGNPGYPGGLHPAGKLTRRIGFNPLLPSAPTVTDDLSYSDAAGRLSGQTTAITGGGNLSTTQQWQFNALGLVAHHSHPRPDGTTPFVVSTDYDAGLPRTQYLNGLPVVTGIAHQPSGALTSYSTGLGIGHNVTTVISQDASLLPRPSRIAATAEGAPSPAFDTQTYNYDGAGNIVAMGPDGFVYDGRSRLTSAALAGLGSQGFSYDRYGNLLSKGAVSFSVSPSTNHITTASYDARGNLTGNGGESYDYDGLNRQLRHTVGSNVWNYAFDGADERLVKALGSSGAWTYTLRDESNRIASEFSGSTPSRDNVFLGNLLVASYAKGSVGGNDRVWTFYASDHLATPRLVTDVSASTLETPRNWPYGENATPAGLFQRIRFASMERDAEASRYYDHARNHEFNLGRFLSPDKLAGKPENPQSWNRYLYVRNNPLTYVDNDGQRVKPAPLVSYETAAQIRQAVQTALLTQPVSGGEYVAAIADYLLSIAIPQDSHEHLANIESSLVGIGTPVSGPGSSLLKGGRTVLGHFPEYLHKAEELGARRFNIPAVIWNKMTDAEQWTANKKFLDRIIKRGDEVVLATPISKVRPGSWLEKEIRYLLEKGYSLDKDGLGLRPPN